MRTRITLVVIALLVSWTSTALADMVAQGNRLRLIVTLHGLKQSDDHKVVCSAGRDSEFQIIVIEGENVFIEFERIRPTGTSKLPDSVKDDIVYVVAKKDLTEATCRFGQGLYAAAITMPFKYRFEKNGRPDALTSDLNIGSAVGWSFGGPAIISTPFVFLGLENFEMSVAPEGDTQLGLTYGIGFACSFARRAQLGFVLGFDHVPGAVGDTWPYQDDPWASVSLGVKFLDW